MDCLSAIIGAKLRFAFLGSLFVEFHSTPRKGHCLEQCKENIVLVHRSRTHMRSLISPLKDIINVFFNGQLVP